MEGRKRVGVVKIHGIGVFEITLGKRPKRNNQGLAKESVIRKNL